MNNIPIDSPFLKILPQDLGFGEGVGLRPYDAPYDIQGREAEELCEIHAESEIRGGFPYAVLHLAKGEGWAGYRYRQKGLDVFVARNWDEMITHVKEHRPNVNQMSASVCTFEDQFGYVFGDIYEEIGNTSFLSTDLPGVTPIPHRASTLLGRPAGFHQVADGYREYDVVIFTQVSEGVSTFRSRGEPAYRFQLQGKQGTWGTDFEMELAAPETGVMYFLDTCKDPDARTLRGSWHLYTRGNNPRVRIISPEPQGRSRTRRK